MAVLSRAKLARGAAQQPDEQRAGPSGRAIAASGAGGAYGIHKSMPHITGRERLYHGTHDAGASAIRAEGLRPRSEVGGHGITDILPESVREQGKSHVYMTPKKVEARSYAVQANALQRHNGDIGAARMNIMQPKEQLGIVNPLNNKGVVQANVPTWKLKQEGKMVANPELLGMDRKAWVAAKKKGNPIGVILGGGDRMLGAQYDSLNRARTISGGIDPKYIKGSGKYQRAGMKEIGEFARAHPGRFAGGLGLAAAGTAGLAYAGHGLYNRLRKQKEASMEFWDGSEEQALAAARLLLKTAGQGIGKPIGAALWHTGRAAKAVGRGAGEVGVGVAKGLRVGETGQEVGKRVAQGVAAGGALYTGNKGKRRVDEFRYRHGLYRGM